MQQRTYVDELPKFNLNERLTAEDGLKQYALMGESSFTFSSQPSPRIGLSVPENSRPQDQSARGLGQARPIHLEWILRVKPFAPLIA